MPFKPLIFLTFPKMRGCLSIRRSPADGSCAYFTTWCPAGTAIERLVEVEGQRWTIEMCQSWRVISLMGVHGKTSAAAAALA